MRWRIGRICCRHGTAHREPHASADPFGHGISSRVSSNWATIADAATGTSGKVVIRDIGLLLLGDIDPPILEADTNVVNNGLITAVRKEKDCDISGAKTTIDARGVCGASGLIDGRVHPVLGDWAPRQSQLGSIASALNGGVTTMISAVEVRLSGQPKEIVGLKALAITAQRTFPNFRPAGVKILAGVPVIEKGSSARC